MSKRNSRAAKAMRRAERAGRGDPAVALDGLAFAAEFGLPGAVMAELDELGNSGVLPAGFKLRMGEVEGKVPAEAVAMAQAGGWQPGWSWWCGVPGCGGGHSIGSPALIEAIGVCTGS